MSNHSERRLQVGGTVNPRTGVYVVRPSDDKLLELLERGEYANVLCSRQMGKSSLLMRTKSRLEQKGYATAAIDIAGYLGSFNQADEWYRGLLDEIAHQLRLPIDITSWWNASTAITPNQRLIRFFRDEVIAKAASPIVIFLDEIDSTHKLPYTDDFFVAIRAIYNDRASDARYDRIRFCLAGVATPNELIKDGRTTPYNVGRTIELQDFDLERDDLSPLVRAMADDPISGETVVSAVLEWTGGHPYLTLRLCDQLLATGGTSPRDVEAVINDEFVSLDQLHSDVHFQEVLRFLDERVDDKVTALELYQRICRGKRVRDETNPAHIALRLAGVVKRDPFGYLAVRNPLYARLFSADWATRVIEDEVKPLDRLLGVLSPDRDLAGEEYERIRTSLIKFFKLKRCKFADDLADETLDRVATRIEDGEVIEDLARYSLGVAQQIAYRTRRAMRSQIALEDVFVEAAQSQNQGVDRCLRKCLQQIQPDQRDLILEYYRESGTAKIQARMELASSLGVSLNALRIRAYSIRAKLESCIANCLKQFDETE